MTFEEAISWYRKNENKKYQWFNEDQGQAFNAILQKLCDLDAQVNELLATRTS